MVKGNVMRVSASVIVVSVRLVVVSRSVVGWRGNKEVVRRIGR